MHFAGLLAEEPSEKLERHRLRRLDRTQQLALITAREAWDDAGSPEVDPLRLGVVMSSGIGGILTTLHQYDIFREKGWKRVSRSPCRCSCPTARPPLWRWSSRPGGGSRRGQRLRVQCGGHR